LTAGRLQQILRAVQHTRILVVGDVMLDQFLWGRVSRISPEAPVPVLEFERENFMPGGAANVARNLSALGARTSLFGATGRDGAERHLRQLLKENQVNCDGLATVRGRHTSIKTRIIAHRQQVVRVDRETRTPLDGPATQRLLETIAARIKTTDAVIVGDYGKGVVTQALLDGIKRLCHERGIWLSLDPKPVHHLDLTGLSLITPNRKETFEMADLEDGQHCTDPLADTALMAAVSRLIEQLHPALLLVTLGQQGMLLCQRGKKPFHIPTFAREVFDVSGAGDTVIASFTLAIAAGASPLEAAIFSNHAAGVVVGKLGTATVAPEELRESFKNG
jgi:D-beta-D-heptose 7-phosphate kinase/D-beta-D-heptose 1-phosphate adenosyltransferase